MKYLLANILVIVALLYVLLWTVGLHGDLPGAVKQFMAVVR